MADFISELFNHGETKQMLKAPSTYIESSRYFSWERFFTSFLVEQTKDSYLQYNKAKLNPRYLQPHEKKAIQHLCPNISIITSKLDARKKDIVWISIAIGKPHWLSSQRK